jgi:PAS domain S-box-containing protein
MTSPHETHSNNGKHSMSAHHKKDQHAHHERRKEFAFMAEMTGHLDDPSFTSDDLLKTIVESAPRFLSRPGMGFVRLSVGDVEAKTDNFPRSKHKKRHDIVVDGKSIGFAEICYPEEVIGPEDEAFAESDMRILESIAVHTGRFTEFMSSKESESQKSAILERLRGFAKLGSWEWTLEDGTLEHSEELPKIIGLDSDELDKFEDFEKHIHPDDRERLDTHIRHMLEDKAPLEIEFRVKGGEGGVKWIHALCEPIWNDAGEPIQITCIMEDVTQRIDAEKALKESEEKFRAIFEEARDGIVLIDYESGHIVECNPEFERQTGRTLRELKEMRIWETRPPNKREVARSKFLEIKDKGSGSSTELEFERPNGEILQIEFNAKVIEVHGKPFIQAMVRDMSHRKVAEEDLRKSKELFEKIFATQSDAIFLLNEERPPIILDCNPAAEKMFGYSREELIGATTEVLHLNPDRMWEFGDRILKDVTSKGSVHVFDWDLRRKDGVVIPTDHSISRLTDENGEVVGRVSVVRDITDRKQADDVKENFLSNITHELRTPLTSIEGYTDLLLSGKIGELQEKHRKCLEVVAEDSDRLRTLIDNALDLMAVDAGKLGLDMSEVSIPVIVDQIVSSLRIELENKGITLFRRMSPDLELVKGDSGKLFQLFSNLLVNAMKFTPDRGSIQIRSESNNGFAIVEISDTGIGISPDDLPHVFDRFYQADSYRNKKHRGMGLGLAICKEIAEAHGGEIEADSQVGKGSVFRVTLPLDTEVSNDKEKSIGG